MAFPGNWTWQKTFTPRRLNYPIPMLILPLRWGKFCHRTNVFWSWFTCFDFHGYTKTWGIWQPLFETNTLSFYSKIFKCKKWFSATDFFSGWCLLILTNFIGQLSTCDKWQLKIILYALSLMWASFMEVRNECNTRQGSILMPYCKRTKASLVPSFGIIPFCSHLPSCYFISFPIIFFLMLPKWQY